MTFERTLIQILSNPYSIYFKMVVCVCKCAYMYVASYVVAVWAVCGIYRDLGLCQAVNQNLAPLSGGKRASSSRCS